MRLITITAILLIVLATLIRTITNLTYSPAPTSMCLTLFQDQPSNIQFDIMLIAGLLPPPNRRP
ncbi:MAG: hypothetical protein U0528_08885 [Anaerolineae bacterium]